MTTISVIIPMYNAAEYIAETLQSVSLQLLPNIWNLEIIVVNDSSTDKSAQIVAAFPDSRIFLVDLKENGGRVSARNLGIKAATGKYCLFLDADCAYHNQDTIGRYICAFESGIRACFGAATAVGDGFWERYQRENYQTRLSRNDLLSLVTSQNFGIEKDLLLIIGGFDARYQHYGFEDRDLYLTIAQYLNHYNIKISPDIKVCHRDRLSLDTVCSKMFNAGRYSAHVFKSKFPQEYIRMPYAKVDFSSLPPRCRPFIFHVLRRRKTFLLMGQKAIRLPIVPYGLKRLQVKCLSALYFMAGTWKQQACRGIIGGK